MQPNQSECRILSTWLFSTNQIAGFLAHVSGNYQQNSEVRTWARPAWERGWDRKWRHQTGNDIIKTGNKRQSMWLTKNTLLFNVLGSLEETVDLVGCLWCKENLQSNGLETRILWNKCAWRWPVGVIGIQEGFHSISCFPETNSVLTWVWHCWE